MNKNNFSKFFIRTEIGFETIKVGVKYIQPFLNLNP